MNPNPDPGLPIRFYWREQRGPSSFRLPSKAHLAFSGSGKTLCGLWPKPNAEIEFGSHGVDQCKACNSTYRRRFGGPPHDAR
jgi:hypothetical protein